VKGNHDEMPLGLEKKVESYRQVGVKKCVKGDILYSRIYETAEDVLHISETLSYSSIVPI
jgi:hypothetical protein